MSLHSLSRTTATVGTLVAGMLLVACSETSQSSASPASPSYAFSPVVPSPASPSPGKVFPDWQAFTSAVAGYAFEHPSSWQQQGSINDSMFIGDYFSNENAGSPEQMDNNGIFFDITLSHDSGDLCAQHDVRGNLIEASEPLVVDNTPASLYAVTTQNVSGRWPIIVLNLEHGGYCYEFSFITMTKQVRDDNLATVRKLLAQTFRFGSGPRPTP